MLPRTPSGVGQSTPTPSPSGAPAASATRASPSAPTSSFSRKTAGPTGSSGALRFQSTRSASTSSSRIGQIVTGRGQVGSASFFFPNAGSTRMRAVTRKLGIVAMRTHTKKFW